MRYFICAMALIICGIPMYSASGILLGDYGWYVIIPLSIGIGWASAKIALLEEKK